MTARLWTALVLLAGVFALHGVQCAVGTDAAPGHAASGHAAPAHAASLHSASLHSAGSSVLAAVPGSQAVAAAGAVTGAVAGTLPGGSATAGVAAAPADPGSHGAPRETAGHLWAVCLAVLAAGLAVLLTVRTPRWAALVPRVVTRVRPRVAGVLAPLRPPDLSALCLLRI